MATKLVPLPDVEKISPLVIRILGGNPGKVSLQVKKCLSTDVDVPHSSHFKVNGF